MKREKLFCRFSISEFRWKAFRQLLLTQLADVYNFRHLLPEPSCDVFLSIYMNADECSNICNGFLEFKLMLLSRFMFLSRIDFCSYIFLSLALSEISVVVFVSFSQAFFH